MGVLELLVFRDRNPAKVTFEMMWDLERALADFAETSEVAFGKCAELVDLFPLYSVGLP